MSKYDGPPIPEITRTTTPTEAEGIRNALKLLRYGAEGLVSGTLPMYNNRLNRKELAGQVGFGRSAYHQNPHIGNVVNWIERQLKQAPQTAISGKASDAERELKAEVERLKNRNIVLKADLFDAEVKIKTLEYKSGLQEEADVRDPWGLGSSQEDELFPSEG